MLLEGGLALLTRMPSRWTVFRCCQGVRRSGEARLSARNGI